MLRTNVNQWSPDELCRTYIQLTDAEAAFRIQKSELEIRPASHLRADRVQAHILVCFLAYVPWKALERWQRRADPGTARARSSTNSAASKVPTSFCRPRMAERLHPFPLLRLTAQFSSTVVHGLHIAVGIGKYNYRAIPPVP